MRNLLGRRAGSYTTEPAEQFHTTDEGLLAIDRSKPIGRPASCGSYILNPRCVSRASGSAFFGSLGHLFGPSHIVIRDRDEESIILSNAAGKALEGSDSHNSFQLCVGFRPRARHTDRAFENRRKIPQALAPRGMKGDVQ